VAITVPYTMLIGLGLLGLGAYVTTLIRQVQLDELRAQLAAEALLVGEVVSPVLGATDGTSLAPAQAAQVQELVGRLSEQTRARVTIVDLRGTVLGDSHQDPARMANHADRPEIAAALAGDPAQSSRHSESIDQDLLYVAAPMKREGNVIGVDRLALPIDSINAGLNRILLAVVTALIVTAGIGVGLAVWIAGTVTVPLRRLTVAANHLARGQLRSEVRISGGGEIGQLADAFNRMAGELNVQVASLGRERDVLASVLANMMDGILLVDRSGTVLVANEAAVRLLDVPQPPEGLSLARVVRDHEICAALEQALAHGTRRGEVRTGGRPARYLRVAAAPLKDGSGGLLVLHDVSEERRVESLRRDFIANVSHELRTAIASLKALVETLEDGALDDPPAALDFLGRMHVEVDGLASSSRSSSSCCGSRAARAT
jgi:two-component system phosphate regulon sensor histidine kinase PhoR